VKKFIDAFNGLKIALKQKAVMTQVILGLCAIVGGFLIDLNYYEWLAFIVCIFVVISLEIVNSCLENICNLICEEYNERIRIIKDMAAAAVLVACIGSLIICVVVCLKKVGLL